jgi:hypothetical protein
VKKQIMCLGIPATHESISALATLDLPQSISDFDAFVFDPSYVHGRATNINYSRRQNEIRDLVIRKGGVVIYLLRQHFQIGFTDARGRAADPYGILDQAGDNILAQIRGALRSGEGSHVEVIPSAKGASAGCYRVLKGKLLFAAYLDAEPNSLNAVGGTVFALDSVLHPIGVEFAIEAGRICFVPIPEGVPGDRIGSAIVRVVEAHYGGPSEIEAPSWAVEVVIPGSATHDARISELEHEKGQIEAEILYLSKKRADLLNYRALLYGYGRSVLEPVVRSAFRLFDFGVLEPEEFVGEWDVELHEPRSALTALGEVEGSDGVIDVDKYRQLLDYVQAEALEERDHKGILIGNGYRLTAPNAAERQAQFSNHALRGATKNQFCLLPTTELFKAVCAVLEFPEDEGLKIGIRDSIFTTVGVWTFARAVAAPKKPATSAAPSDEGSI